MRHTCSAAWARGSVGRRLSHETQDKTVGPAIGALRGAMNGKDISEVVITPRYLRA